jgi:hypothetical protein
MHMIISRENLSEAVSNFFLIKKGGCSGPAEASVSRLMWSELFFCREMWSELIGKIYTNSLCDMSPLSNNFICIQVHCICFQDLVWDILWSTFVFVNSVCIVTLCSHERTIGFAVICTHLLKVLLLLSCLMFNLDYMCSGTSPLL